MVAEVPRHSKSHMNPSKELLYKILGHFTETKSKMATLLFSVATLACSPLSV
jgi:hypothetical protein